VLVTDVVCELLVKELLEYRLDDELLSTELLEDGPLDETLRLEEVLDVDDGLEELEMLEEEEPVELTLDDIGEDRLDDDDDDDKLEDKLDEPLEDDDTEERTEELDVLEYVDVDGVDDTLGERLEDTLEIMLEDDEVKDFEDTVLAVELELIGLIVESDDACELDGLDVWEFVEE
jgi:hypothetical protein